MRLSYSPPGRGAIPFLVAFALVALAIGFATGAGCWRRPRTPPGSGRASTGCSAVLVGALTNDSGPIILLIGSSYLLFAAVYLAAVPSEGARPAAKKESRPCRRLPLIASRGCE